MDSKTRLYGLIGHPIGHSLSPLFQNRLIEMHGINACYLAFDIIPENLGRIRDVLRTLNLGGLNVTVPHKEKIIPQLDRLDESARNIKAVNTIHWVNNELIGYNTDVLGFGMLIDSLNLEEQDVQPVVLGAGGAARAVIQALKMRGEKRIMLYNRTVSKAQKLVDELGFQGVSIDSIGNYVPDDRQLIINTTSVGLKIGESPIFIDRHLKDSVVIDVIYNPFKTDLLRMAEENGIRTCNGLSMLIYQGIRSFEIWHDISVEKNAVESIFEEMRMIVEEK